MSDWNVAIPADILKTAEALFEPYVALYDGPSEADVAALILAERKRCAALARTINEKHWDEVLKHGGPEAVARAIEEGRQP